MSNYRPIQSLTHIPTQTCSLCWQCTEQLCLINCLICRPFCSVLFSFNEVLLCYCYHRRENMKKCQKLRHSTVLTNHTSYCCVCVCVPLLLCECVFACEVFCSPEDALAGWQVQAMGKLAMDGIAMDSADGLSLKKHSPIRFLNFSQYLLNTLQPVPPSICACVFLWFVCSEIILQPYNHLLF